MNVQTKAPVAIRMYAWATPTLKWFNFIPAKFEERKAAQVQTLVDELEAEKKVVMEYCKNPFVTSVKIADTVKEL